MSVNAPQGPSSAACLFICLDPAWNIYMREPREVLTSRSSLLLGALVCARTGSYVAIVTGILKKIG